MPIPRIIHQTARDFDSLPDAIKANFVRIKELNPGWDWRFYDDAAVLDYIGKHISEPFRQRCERLSPGYGAVLADLFRYLVIYREGGVYLDCKSSITRPLDSVLRPDDVYLLSQWANQPGERFDGWGMGPDLYRLPQGEFQQWHLVSIPGHPFLEEVLRQVQFNILHYHPGWFGVGTGGVLRLTGPICYSLAIAPMIHHYRHRFLDIETLGFVYTIYEGVREHQVREEHYSRRDTPIFTRSV